MSDVDPVAGAMPMFPLGATMLPTAALPLHVFEPRYRQLVVDCLAADADPPRFGTVLIERGHEVGGGDERAGVGVLATMHDITAFEDGRYHFVAVGVQRLRIAEWLDDSPYPRALVEPWPDPDHDDPTLTPLVAPARQRLASVLELAAQAGLAVQAADVKTSDHPATAVFQLGVIAPLGPADRYRLLGAPSVRDRFRVLGEALDDVESMLRFRLT